MNNNEEKKTMKSFEKQVEDEMKCRSCFFHFSSFIRMIFYFRFLFFLPILCASQEKLSFHRSQIPCILESNVADWNRMSVKTIDDDNRTIQDEE